MTTEFEAALAARDAAMAQVEANAPEWWRRVAYAAVVEVARTQPFLTSEDPRNLCDRHGVPEPQEPRIWGPVMRRAIAAGVIEPTGRHTRYTRRSRHTGVTYVWRSLLYPGEG